MMGVARDSVTAPVAAEAVIWFEVPAIVVGSAVHPSAPPVVSMPWANWPAGQLAPFACKAVAVDALPVKFALIVPALKFPEESRWTIVLTVFRLATPKPFARVLLFVPDHCGTKLMVLVAGPKTSPLPPGVKHPSALPEASTPAAA